MLKATLEFKDANGIICGMQTYVRNEASIGLMSTVFQELLLKEGIDLDITYEEVSDNGNSSSN